MKKLVYLKSIFNFIGLGLIITTLSRIVLFFIFKERINATPNYWYIFPIGLRFDFILLCYLSFLPALLITFVPNNYLRFIQRFLNCYYILFLILILLTELASPNFVLQYDTRPNRLFLDYLIYPKEVMGMLFKSYLPSLIITLRMKLFYFHHCKNLLYLSAYCGEELLLSLHL